MEMDKLDNKKIAVIGMGHMGKALMEGLIVCGFKKENILISSSNETNRKVATDADWIILAIKPAVVSKVILEIKDIILDKLLFSVAAGVGIATIEEYIGNSKQKIIRLMPNLPIVTQQGILGYYANANVTNEENETAISFFSGMGKVVVCTKEEELDVITVIAGCGPALVAYFVSLFSQSGYEFGLDEKVSEALALQTFTGTLEYMNNTRQTAEELQTSVATKGGITESILNSLNEKEIPSQFIESLEQGYAKVKGVEDSLKNSDKEVSGNA